MRRGRIAPSAAGGSRRGRLAPREARAACHANRGRITAREPDRLSDGNPADRGQLFDDGVLPGRDEDERIDRCCHDGHLVAHSDERIGHLRQLFGDGRIGGG